MITVKSQEIWHKAEPILMNWQKNLSLYESRHRGILTHLLNDFSRLFDSGSPTKIIVDLHFHPFPGSHKGEPANGLVSTRRITKNDTDIFYWLSEMPDSQSEETLGVITVKIIHEAIHQFFQSESLFKELVDHCNVDKEIEALRKEFLIAQPSYLNEPEAEITAIYLEGYLKQHLQNTSSIQKESSQLIEYRVNELRFNKIFKAVIEENDSWKGESPYSKLVSGWLNNATNSTVSPSSSTIKIVSIYELGGRIIDFSLFEKYRSEGKTIDIAFIKRLYKLFLENK